MTLLKIITAPDPILKTKSKEVDSVDDSIRLLMDNMLETMYADNGVGLAANQIGETKRVIVLDLQDDDEVEREEDFYPLFIANPVITDFSENYVEAAEACLSVPDQRIDVSRPDKISIEYLNYNNKKQSLSASGWLARALQHEIDHIDGKILIDYLSPLKKNVAIRKLNKLKKNGSYAGTTDE